MSLGEKLLKLRRREGLSQEEVAQKLDVSRQTVSKWETNQTLPELSKAKLISQLYNVTYDYLMDECVENFDITNIDSLSDSIDWTSAWSKKYPILATYQQTNGVDRYKERTIQLYQDFKNEFDFCDTDTVLVLKDILYHVYLEAKEK